MGPDDPGEWAMFDTLDIRPKFFRVKTISETAVPTQQNSVSVHYCRRDSSMSEHEPCITEKICYGKSTIELSIPEKKALEELQHLFQKQPKACGGAV